MVGNEMFRGISGRQRKRVTTGEMLVGPANAMFMDEISNGLDSSTTFQIVNSLKQYVHILNGTALISLLQPTRETYELFDDVILISDGEIVYQGPREHVLDFFEYVGFKCPERKTIADFLQEVTSKKDQEQYWARKDQPYRFITVTEFVEAFQSFHVGRRMGDELATPFDKSLNHPAALTTQKYGISKKELLKANFSREFLLMKRNSFVYIFKLFQLTCIALIVMTLFLRTKMHRESVSDGVLYSGALFFSVLILMFNGMFEIPITIAKLPVLYKQRDHLFYPSWTYAIPNWIIKIPVALLEVSDWIILTYFVIGYDPNVGRFFKQYLVLFLANQMGSGLFRAIAAVGRNMIVANTFGSFTLLIVLVLGGFILSRTLEKRQATITDDESEDNTTNGIAQEIQLPRIESSTRVRASSNSSNNGKNKKGMILPFEPHSISFDKVVYAIDMPQNEGVEEDRLVLLRGVSGAFRPGVLTALMGVSGAGKTTMLDVLAGRKTGGYIEGSIKISGYPKKQETFARISGYCEQTDVHSPHVTVYESLLYSSWLRLPVEINSNTKKMFIEEVMELVELNVLRNSLVGLAGETGLSTEQRKRLTIAVELVANPSIIFMDEPTSGLDARAAAIVMRTVRNTVDTGRTVVCTIHQPSIDIFEAFDESIDGVSKIKDGYNPATWMLEVTSPAQELNLGVDFHEIYKNPDLYTRNQSLIAELGNPVPGSKGLYFQTQYSQPFLVQCLACLWKQHWSYWRNPLYTAVRFFTTLVISLIFGTSFWKLGDK
ncbi:transcription factor [Stylosanthes scabra]|uniref:Transcription factor n=1 Tax=Stylosanthes scabra TaxID=79078 RepID=A0ABU6SJD7_9FABA|nr:transcription factor [Stylosanthes scabra]